MRTKEQAAYRGRDLHGFPRSPTKTTPTSSKPQPTSPPKSTTTARHRSPPHHAFSSSQAPHPSSTGESRPRPPPSTSCTSPQTHHNVAPSSPAAATPHPPSDPPTPVSSRRRPSPIRWSRSPPHARRVATPPPTRPARPPPSSTVRSPQHLSPPPALSGGVIIGLRTALAGHRDGSSSDSPPRRRPVSSTTTCRNGHSSQQTPETSAPVSTRTRGRKFQSSSSHSPPAIPTAPAFVDLVGEDPEPRASTGGVPPPRRQQPTSTASPRAPRTHPKRGSRRTPGTTARKASPGGETRPAENPSINEAPHICQQTRYIPADFDEHVVWADLSTCTKPFTPRISKAIQLKKPALRYLHRFISHSIIHRDSSDGVVNCEELFFLHCMLNGIRVNTSCFLLSRLKSTKHATSRPLGGGGIVAALGSHFDVDLTRYRVHPTSTSLGFETAVKMGLLDNDTVRGGSVPLSSVQNTMGNSAAGPGSSSAPIPPSLPISPQALEALELLPYLMTDFQRLAARQARADERHTGSQVSFQNFEKDVMEIFWYLAPCLTQIKGALGIV
ncbi:hypothetical protein Tsubulata_019037 [Turnera subulata]|uniref:Uncharacterized protein n=1 Tax=Turnera subulata TaxID=218843 RepID=A0A9Q0FFB4_9ROSI|nr:hypothetical protein Tsubulata_019037 [Turnera subulata]